MKTRRLMVVGMMKIVECWTMTADTDQNGRQTSVPMRVCSLVVHRCGWLEAERERQMIESNCPKCKQIRFGQKRNESLINELRM